MKKSAVYNLIRAGITVEKLHDLLLAGANPNAITVQGETCLHFVASKNETNPQDTEDCLQMARELIAFGADVNKENDYFFTPLIFAVRAIKWRMVELLLEAKADVNLINYEGNTALHYAVKNHCIVGRYGADETMRVVKALLRSHPEMDLKNKMGYTPLIIAVRYNDFQIVQELLRHNASVNYPDSKRNSALHHALQQEEVNENIVLELVRHGGDFSIRNCDGKNALDVYITRLLNYSCDEAKKAKFVFKLYMLGGNSISTSQRSILDARSKEKNRQLSRFLVHCYNEIRKMRRDEIAPKYYMYKIALSGFSYRTAERNHPPLDVLDKVLDKLLKGQYPVFCDLIVSGICSPYINKKFAEICSSVRNAGRANLNFDAFLSLSSYLSPVDMFYMMLACSPDSIWVQISELRRRYLLCNVDYKV